MSTVNPVLDAGGKPLDYFVFSVSEKIGLPNYSSIDLFVSLGRHVSDDEASRQGVVEEVEQILGRERDIVRESLGLNS